MTAQRAGARSVAPIVGAFAAIALGFLASTFYGEVRASQIDQEAALLASNSLPGVERLVAAEAALRHLEVATEEYANGTGDERRDAGSAIDAARGDMDRELSAEALVTRMYPGGAELAAATTAALAQLDELLARLCEISSNDRLAGKAFFEADVRGAIERTDAALDRFLSLHAAEAQAEAVRIARIRTESVRLAFGLDALCVLFSAAAAFVAVRALRNQRAAERVHAKVLETRADELESFARRVAHDLLGPLSALSANLSVMKRSCDQGLSIDEPLRRSLASLKRSQRLVDGVLDFARSGARPAPGERASLRDAIDGVIEEVRGEKTSSQVLIVVQPCDDDVVVPCSPGILASVVSNLVHNAVKYAGDGEGSDRRVSIRVSPGDDDVRVEVEDNGRGLSPEVAQHVFEPYFRAPDNEKVGLGLGLATVKRFVEAHGGSVGVRPAPHRGCVFWFRLPRGWT